MYILFWLNVSTAQMTSDVKLNVFVWMQSRKHFQHVMFCRSFLLSVRFTCSVTFVGNYTTAWGLGIAAGMQVPRGDRPAAPAVWCHTRRTVRVGYASVLSAAE